MLSHPLASKQREEALQVEILVLLETPSWCESTLLEDRLRAALRAISALSALRWSKMIFRRFLQSRTALFEMLRNTPLIICSDLLESALHWKSVLSTERFLGRKNVQKIYVLQEWHEMKF